MENVNLPLENAREPDEDARQPDLEKQILDSQLPRQNVTFVENTSDCVLRTKRTYTNILSQPPKGVTHRQKLIWLQQRRTAGLWAQCDDCDSWRYLPHVLDNHELPTKWYCWMNPDASLATCSVPEVPICLHDEEDLIHAEYAAGSVVLARLPGFPWWPAMVDDCPDTEQYYWLDGFCDIPTHYNVVFFDSHDVSRAWIEPENLMPYKDKKILNKFMNVEKYKKRLNVAISQADDAIKLALSARLAKYSFIARYNGQILSPTKIKKRDLEKFQNKLKRKFNVDFCAEFSDSSDEDNNIAEKIRTKRANRNKDNASKTNKNNRGHDNDELSENTNEILTNATKDINKNNRGHDNDELSENTNEILTNATKDINSLTVQIDSESGLLRNSLNAVSNTDKEKEIDTTSDLHKTQEGMEEVSQRSDDFDF